MAGSRQGPRIIVALVAVLASPLSAQDAPPWRLASPHFEAGGVEAAGDDALTELGGVTLLDDGAVLVGDRAAPFLKLFSADGRFLRALGRFGSGPGEYEYVYEMDWCSSDELSVYDVNGRVHRYRSDLELVGTDLVSLDAIGGGVAYNRDCHPNGLQVVTGWGDFRAQFRRGLYNATAPVLLLHDQEVVHDFGERLSSERIGSVRSDGSPGGSGPHPFGRATVVALGASRVFVGSGDAYEIEVYDFKGNPLAPIQWSGPDLDYDSDLVQQLADEALSNAAESERPRLRRQYEGLPRLDQLPAYDRLLVSDADQLWVRQFVRPGATGEDWIVFDDSGTPIGQLRLPPASTLWEVRGDQVVYSTLDEFDVPVVKVSRIVK